MNTYKNYIDLLRKILKNFDNDEFNSIINKILIKIFREYYINKTIKFIVLIIYIKNITLVDIIV